MSQQYFQNDTFLSSRTSLFCILTGPLGSHRYFSAQSYKFPSRCMVERHLPTFSELRPGMALASPRICGWQWPVCFGELRGACVPFVELPFPPPCCSDPRSLSPGFLSNSIKQRAPANHFWTCEMAIIKFGWLKPLRFESCLLSQCF